MSLGPFGLLMMKNLNVVAIFNEAVLENTTPMKALMNNSHSKSFCLLFFFASALHCMVYHLCRNALSISVLSKNDCVL